MQREMDDDGFETVHPVLGDTTRMGIVERVVELEKWRAAIGDADGLERWCQARLDAEAETRKRLDQVESSAAIAHRRLAELESSGTTRPGHTSTITREEHARYSRIEAAARRLLESPCPMGDAIRAQAWAALREAVQR